MEPTSRLTILLELQRKHLTSLLETEAQERWLRTLPQEMVLEELELTEDDREMLRAMGKVPPAPLTVAKQLKQTLLDLKVKQARQNALDAMIVEEQKGDRKDRTGVEA